jgi:hypothetical protein
VTSVMSRRFVKVKKATDGIKKRDEASEKVVLIEVANESNKQKMKQTKERDKADRGE